MLWNTETITIKHKNRDSYLNDALNPNRRRTTTRKRKRWVWSKLEIRDATDKRAWRCVYGEKRDADALIWESGVRLFFL
ncbi:hypothetical protein Bca4012_022618 [Brassica carinata]